MRRLLILNFPLLVCVCDVRRIPPWRVCIIASRWHASDSVIWHLAWHFVSHHTSKHHIHIQHTGEAREGTLSRPQNTLNPVPRLNQRLRNRLRSHPKRYLGNHQNIDFQRIYILSNKWTAMSGHPISSLWTGYVCVSVFGHSLFYFCE